MPVAEAFYTVYARQFSLGDTGLGQSKIVESKISGDMRLIVPSKERPGLGDIDPLGEPLAPPVVVLRDRMKLG